MTALSAITSAVTVLTLRTVIASKDRVITVNAANLTNAGKLAAAHNYSVAAFRGYLLLMEGTFLADREREQGIFAETMRTLDANVPSAEGHRLLREIEAAQTDLLKVQERIIELRKTKGGLEAATLALHRDALPQRSRITSAIQEFVEREQRLLDQGRTESTATGKIGMGVGIVMALLAFLFAAATTLLLGRVLSRQVGSAVQHIQSSSTELQTSANQQATGSRETATLMNEISTTMSELLATSRQIAESAQQVARISEETAGAARTGDQTVAQAQDSIEAIRRQVHVIVDHMLELGKKSQLIGGILDIINELAEQTNILSINATIEAAGAGEHGKRFAVVGDEIRKLADRVAGSTKDVRGLVEEIRGAINTTVLATETGSKSVDSGLHHFEELMLGFKHIGELVETTTQAAREIQLSTKQQTSAVEQVTSAISGAAQASRENETSSGQTLQTATELAHLSQNLAHLVHSKAHV